MEEIAEYDFVYTLSSTNIDQSAQNLVKLYAITRSGMSLIMDLIGQFAIFDFVYTLTSANIDQSVPNLATIYMPIRSRMRLITVQIEQEHLELFALKFGKIAENDFIYTVSSTNIDQSALHLFKMYVIIGSRLSMIMDLIGPELSELSALELENLPYLTLFTL